MTDDTIIAAKCQEIRALLDAGEERLAIQKQLQLNYLMLGYIEALQMQINFLSGRTGEEPERYKRSGRAMREPIWQNRR